MGGLVMLERFVWFDRELKSGRYPNASRLARKFEISVKTAQRTIDFMRDRFLEFTYQSPGTGRKTRRRVEPHHLQHYMASWVLIAFCHMRMRWRTFFIARMTRLEILAETFSPRPEKTWRCHLGGAFGIFQGDCTTKVVLRFTPFRARWIREQFWHPEQTIRPLENGGLELEFPVADFREVKMKILQFGADVEVIEPAELREIVKEEITKMARIYP